MAKWHALRNALLILLLVFVMATPATCHAERNPYKVMGLAKDSSQNDIQRRYKKLCLKYHPDKNIGKSQRERRRCEDMFKQVQQAYSLVGDEQARHQFDARSTMPSGHYADPTWGRSSFDQTSSMPQGASDPITEAFFAAFGNSGASNFFGQGQPRFRVHRPFPSAPGSSHPHFPGIGSFESVYIQTVQVPLETLYVGHDNYRLAVRDNFYTRWRAAIRGGSIYLSLYQGFIYAIPTLRSSKIVAAIIGLLVIHATLPKPDPTQYYSTRLKRGTRGGDVELSFPAKQHGQPKVIFRIQEAPHDRYTRVGNDLHTEIFLSPQEAEIGCVKEIPSLDPREETPISVQVAPRQQRSIRKSKLAWFQRKKKVKENDEEGNIVVVKGKGWPSGTFLNSNAHGDLIVRIRVRKQRDTNNTSVYTRWMKMMEKRKERVRSGIRNLVRSLT